MKILAWQKSNNVFRFIYALPSGDLNVASVENYAGMESFLFYSDAIKLDGAIDIWEYKDKSL